MRSKQAAGLVVKQFHALLPQLWGHANALQAADDRGLAEEFTDLLTAAEEAAHDLLTEPEDADEREDGHDNFTDVLGDLTDFLPAHGGA